MRRRLVRHGFGADRAFRWRGGEISRLEGLSDAVFLREVVLHLGKRHVLDCWHGSKYGRFPRGAGPGILPGMTRLRTVTTAELSAAELEAVREMVFAAFGGRFDTHDWEHTLGGVHVVAVEDDAVVAHGAVVPRTLWAARRGLRTGYVEGVATREDRRGRGLATLVMREVGRVVERDYELGALSDGTRIPGFYQRLGWETWQGPTWAAGPEGRERTAEDDGSILVLRTPATGELELTGSLTCDWRPGDVW